MRQDILIQLELDPRRRTLGELLQERDVRWRVVDIEQWCSALEAATL